MVVQYLSLCFIQKKNELKGYFILLNRVVTEAEIYITNKKMGGFRAQGIDGFANILISNSTGGNL
jgi:hypothetical protein